MRKMESNINEIKPFKCAKCISRFKTNGNLKSHILYKHTPNNEINWIPCTIKNCTFRFKINNNLKKHILYKHTPDNEINWTSCTIENCISKFKTNSNLKRHIKFKHTSNDKFNWIPCTIENCTSKFKTNDNLKQHIFKKHTPDNKINWIPCTIENCISKFKTNSELKKHILHKHTPDNKIKWKLCIVENCTSKFKTNSELKKHLSLIHDLGDKNCNFCKRNVYKLISHQNIHGKHKICRKCYNKVTGKNSRAEKQMGDYLDKNIGTEFLLGSDKSLKSMGGCQLYRPDKLYSDPNIVIHIECDEFQHKRSNTTYLCDEKRISDIYNEFPGKKYIVIRWNPDHYKSLRNKKRCLRPERLKLLVDLFCKVQQHPPDNIITIYYMFYNADNPLIAKNIPYYLIQNENDLNKLFKKY